MAKAKKPEVNTDQLHLVLKSVWYNKIEAGKKTEEYRDFNDYWAPRLGLINKDNEVYDTKTFKTVKFSYGYTSKHMIFEVKGIYIDTFLNVVPAECEKGKTYFTIELGKRLV